ncbi:MAG TPA: HD domain-containing protein [Polyangiaceae bacterium]|nr:HD domain-containing protein [Polyangiaceae bacterium]
MTTSLEASALDTLRRAIPDHVFEIARVLERGGHRTWVVGGSLRDQLRTALDGSDQNLGADWDLATDAQPEVVQRLFKRVIPTGIKHGTVTVLLGQHGYEVTTLRGETDYTDGRRPDSVFFVDEIRKDLARRDFTINAIAYDPLTHVVEDPFDGVGDLKRRLIRAVGSPGERFGEDGLRVLRAARFVTTLEFDLDPATERAIEPSLDSFRKVSLERVRDEWIKTMKGRAPSRAFRVMRDHGLLAVTAPALLAGGGAGREAPLDVALRAVDASTPNGCVRFAALLHNIGSSSTSDQHADHSAELAFGLLSSLRFSNKERDRIVNLVRHHVAFDPDQRSDADLRRWLRRVGPELLEDLQAVMSAIARAHAVSAEPPSTVTLDQIQRLFERARVLLELAPPLSIAALALTGNDLRQELSLPPGPLLGRILQALLELVLEDPEQNQRERLLVLARETATKLQSS